MVLHLFKVYKIMNMHLFKVYCMANIHLFKENGELFN